MRKSALAAILFWATLLCRVSCAQPPAQTFPSDAEIRSILSDRIDKQHQSVGIIVGLIDSPGRRTISYGKLDTGDSRAVNGDTIFEIGSKNGREIVWHNGGTGGFRAFTGFDPKARIGVVVLSDSETSAGVDDIGQHLLDASIPLWQPPQEHTQVTVAPKIFDGYVGQYELTPNFVIAVTREGDHLFVQATGQPKLEIFPEGDRDYFLKAVDAQITFETDSAGNATGLILHQNGVNQSAKRIQ